MIPIFPIFLRLYITLKELPWGVDVVCRGRRTELQLQVLELTSSNPAGVSRSERWQKVFCQIFRRVKHRDESGDLPGEHRRPGEDLGSGCEATGGCQSANPKSSDHLVNDQTSTSATNKRSKRKQIGKAKDRSRKQPKKNEAKSVTRIPSFEVDALLNKGYHSKQRCFDFCSSRNPSLHLVPGKRKLGKKYAGQ